MNIGIFAKNPDYAAAPMLARALRELGHDVLESYISPSRYNFPSSKENEIPRRLEVEHIIFAGSNGFSKYLNKYGVDGYLTVTVIITDSAYLKSWQKYNDLFQKHNVKVHAFPWITRLSGGTPFYHAMYIPDYNVKKTIQMCHSPGKKGDRNLKGTNCIKSVCEYLGIDLCVINDMSWDECVQTKARSKMFVDEIIGENPDRFGASGFHGEIGKSGLEAMWCGAVVFASGEFIDTMPYFPPPPVIWVNPFTFMSEVKEMMSDEIKLQQASKRQQQWIRKWMAPKLVAQRIVGAI